MGWQRLELSPWDPDLTLILEAGPYILTIQTDSDWQTVSLDPAATLPGICMSQGCISQPNRPYPTGSTSECPGANGQEIPSDEYLTRLQADASPFTRGDMSRCIFPLTVVALGCTCASGKAADFYDVDVSNPTELPCK